jgi:hypothetical protein
MNPLIKELLLSSNKKEMIIIFNSHPEYFNELLELSILDHQPYSWRAAWLLNSCMLENDIRIKKSIKNIIEAVKTKKDGHQRELLKILDRMKLTEKYDGLVFSICMDIWEQIGKSPSVRIISLKFIIKIALKYPDLLKEIEFLTQDHYLDNLSPGIKNSAKRIIEDVNSVK